MPTKEKLCTKCNDLLPIELFGMHNQSQDGRNWWCKKCVNMQAKFYRQFNPRPFRKSKMKYRYGVAIDVYDFLFAKQNGKCAICDCIATGPYDLHYDHDHKNNKSRGLLCGNCNRGIGMFKDSEQLLLRAVSYVCKSLSAPVNIQHSVLKEAYLA